MSFEQTLCAISECHVYRIPPRQSAGGYKAQDWEGNHIWTGQCTVVAKGDDCEVRLIDRESNEIFAVCKVTTTGAPSVERCEDSRRYFVLRIQDDSGKHAYIGIGFTQRSEAFDFNVALEDHRKQVERSHAPQPELTGPSEDFSLKEGQTIRVEIAGKVKVQDKKPTGHVASSGTPKRGLSLAKATEKLSLGGGGASSSPAPAGGASPFSSSTSSSSSSSSSAAQRTADLFDF